MKRSTKLALSLVLGAGLVAPAFAQDNFPDVPANHWAYEALARMKRDGLLVGYPDGLYRGGRPASRYELAVAMHAVYTNLKNITDGLDAQIRAMSQPTGDIQALKDAVAALQAQLAAMRGYGDDIAALKRAAETFDKELKSLGVDVDAMKKELVDLSGRVGALEAKKPSIDISGDVNLLVLAGHSTGGTAGIDMDGRLVGVTPTGARAGLQQDLSVLHEGAFTFAGTNATGVKFTGTAVIGNMISDGTDFGGNSFGSQSVLPFGRYNDNVNDDVYIQNLQASFDTRVLGLGGVGLAIGRLQKKVDPWSFQRIDNTSYYSNERWDNGKYTVDGANADFKIFGAKASAFGGRTSGRNSLNGIDLSQVVLGNNRVAGNAVGVINAGTGLGTGGSDEFQNLTGVVPSSNDVDRILGLETAFPLFKVGNINLSYLWMDSDSETTGVLGSAGVVNRLEVYGGNADFTFGRIKIGGSYHQNDVKAQGDPVVTSNETSAFDATVGYKGNRFDVYGKFREVEANYIAPGDWGRLGILRNPSNIRGFIYGGSFTINNTLVLSGSGESNTGLNGTGDFSSQPFDGNTTINNYAVRLDYKFSPNVSLYGSFEETRFANLAGAYDLGVTSKYRFATVGLGYGLSERAKLNFSYQYMNVKNEAFLGVGSDNEGYNRGGLLTTQLTVKF